MNLNKASTTTTTSPSLISKTEAITSAGNKKAVSQHERTTRCDCNGLPALLHSLPIAASASNSILDINEHGSLEQLLDNLNNQVVTTMAKLKARQPQEEDDDKDEDEQSITAVTLLSASLSRVSYTSLAATLLPAAKAMATSSKRNVRFVCDDESMDHSSSSTSANKQDNIDDRKKKRIKLSRRNSVVIRDDAQLSRISNLMKN
jgi:hypothetical protein